MSGPTETAILVVAPDATDQLLSTILSTAQLANTPLGPSRITWAHTFEEGMNLLSGRPFEACLVDSGLGPGCIAFLRSARTQGWRRPLIFCTSVGQHDMQAAAQAAGASDILLKTSVSLSTLGRVIQAAIQRSRFEETLRFGEEMVRILVEGTRDYAIYMLDREGRVLTWNQGAERIKGYSSLEVLGHHYSMFFTEEDRANLKPAENLRHAVSHGRFEEEAWRTRKDGSRFWAHVVITPLYGADGQLRGFSKVSRDITPKKAEDEKHFREGARFTEAFRASPIGSSITTLEDGTFLDANDAFCRIFGYEREELVGKRSKDLPAFWPDPADRDRVTDILRRDGAVKDLELVAHNRKGEPKLLRVSANRIDIDGQACVMSTTSDVTTERFFQGEVARRESRLREAERIAGMASWEWDVAGRSIQWSPNMYAMLGLDPAVAQARLGTYLDLVHPDERAGVADAMRAVRDRPAPFENQHRIVRPDGTVRWIRARAAVSPGEKGPRIVGTIQDVTSELAPAQRAPEETREETAALDDATATQVAPLRVAITWQVGPKLILVKGGLEGSVFPLDLAAGPAWQIGRGEGADVALANDPYVSRRCAEVRRDGEGFVIQGLAARNGTYLNGRLLNGKAEPLQDGDIVGIGRSLLVFRSK